MNCLLIDDEPLALALLETYVRRVPQLTLLGKYTNPVEAVAAIHAHTPDVIFLDISMPALSGIELFKSLAYRPQVVFTTAHADFAVEGFTLNATDYLLKPIAFDRFLQAVNKLTPAAQAAPAAPLPGKDSFYVKVEYQMERIPVADILYIEGLDDYVKIHLFGASKPILTHTSLRTILDKLPPQGFIRIHRSFIVALNRIESYNRRTLRIHGRDIPIGETYAEPLWAILEG